MHARVVLALIEQPYSIKSSPDGYACPRCPGTAGQWPGYHIVGKIGEAKETAPIERSTAEGLNSVSRSRHINRQ